MSAHSVDDQTITTVGLRQNDGGNTKRVILSEETYTSTISHIIKRDYYPDIDKLQSLKEGAEGQERFPQNALVAVDGTNDASLGQETLTGFHARATNEDDHEFDTNQREEIQANRKRLQHVFDNGNSSSQNGKQQDKKLKMLLQDSALASDQFLLSATNDDDDDDKSDDKEQPLALTMGDEPQLPPKTQKKGTPSASKPYRNGLFFVPTPVVEQQATVNVQQKDTVKRLTDSSHHWEDSDAQFRQVIPRPRNEEPTAAGHDDGDRKANANTTAAIASSYQAQSQKSIHPAQTRFPPNFIKGRIASPDDNSVLFDMDDISMSNSTTSRTTAASSVTHSFQLPHITIKEKAAQSAEEHMSHRTKRAKLSSSSSRRPDSIRSSASPRPPSNLPRKSSKLIRSLTPAARALLERSTAYRQRGGSTPLQRSSSLRTPSSKRGNGDDPFISSLRQSYTPTPKTGRSKSKNKESGSNSDDVQDYRGRNDHVHNATPIRRL